MSYQMTYRAWNEALRVANALCKTVDLFEIGRTPINKKTATRT